MDTAQDAETHSESDAEESAYLAFKVGEESYLISVTSVVEVIRMPKMQSLPDVADFMAGVVNLRGKVIPVVDLNIRFGQPVVTRPERRVVMVVEDSDQVVGVVVDRVEQVREVVAANVECNAIGKPGIVAGLYGEGTDVSSIVDVAVLFADCATDINLVTSDGHE